MSKTEKMPAMPRRSKNERAVGANQRRLRNREAARDAKCFKDPYEVDAPRIPEDKSSFFRKKVTQPRSLTA